MPTNRTGADRLVTVYRYYFEKRNKVCDHPNVHYYGRYIDDCLAIVYAQSEQEAVDIMSGLVRFDNCTITWDCSEGSAPFLDMLLYKDADNSLQHMPYRKRGNHQERIPWISSHPYDVKRGTFFGEMSRLATLSSKHEHYHEAMRGLVALYIYRSYLHKWLYSNLAKRWNQCLEVKTPDNSVDILVLKTQYNLAWNYFSASQLGDTIFGYWQEWLNRADSGKFDQEFPKPSQTDRRISDWSNPETAPGRWDLRETSIFNSRIILSRKRTRNFLDLMRLWKNSVIDNLELNALDDIVADSSRAFIPAKRNVNTAVVGPRLKRAREDPENDSENKVEHVARRFNSPTPRNSAWASGSMRTWGKGSRW
jgi:hypothetical protein